MEESETTYMADLERAVQILFPARESFREKKNLPIMDSVG